MLKLFAAILQTLMKFHFYEIKFFSHLEVNSAHSAKHEICC